MSKKIYLQLLSLTLLCICTLMFGQEKVEVGGAIIIENSEAISPAPGTLRWTGNDFQGWNGVIWVSLTGNAKVGSVADIDGNTYKTIRIGNQEWMVQNLRVTKYKDNTTIDQITSNVTWQGLSAGAWCWNNNDNSFDVPYGKLYNWNAVNTTKLCPNGWHVPSDTEWTTLTDFLGGPSSAGGRMKEIGLTHWDAPNAGANNESGFTGLPGGLRFSPGSFALPGLSGHWWSSSTESSEFAWSRTLLSYNGDVISTSNDKKSGYTVRCVKG